MNEHWKTIEGWTDQSITDLYDAMVYEAKDGAEFVEVGTYKGKSLCYLGAKIVESEKAIILYGIDHFKDDSTEEVLRENMRKSGCKNWFVCKGVSNYSVLSFQDKSIDFCFLDACHEYESVKLDILTWLPKIKVGGVLAGHDYAPEWPGVIKAVTELLPGHTTIGQNYRSWMYRVRDK